MARKMISKILFDHIAAFCGLLILSPLFLFISLFIKYKMPDGPVIFKQTRIGKNGKTFTIYKFRTMENKNYYDTVSVRGESRITPLGSFLRKYKLDELPELVNILKGEMSFVGPRPDVPGYADKLEGDDRLILELKPGLTGPASLAYYNEEEILSKVNDPIKYNNEVIYPDKVRINLEYLKKYSFYNDIKIIAKTILRKY